jgi:transposase
VGAALAVLQRMVFGDSSERSRPEPPTSQGEGGGEPAPGGTGGSKGRPRGPGARAGRRDYSHLPRVEVIWDFGDGGYCCPECGTPFTGLGSDHVTELLDWQVIVRVAAHCRRRYRRACDCRVPAAVTAPGPPKAIGKGLFSNAFIAMLLTERLVAGRSMNSLVTGLGRQGAEISPATLAGTSAQAGALLAPLADAIAERSRNSWHLHADETTWRVFAPRDGSGPAKWWLWVFIGPDTVCFVMDPTRAGAVLARRAGKRGRRGRMEKAQKAWDTAVTVIDETRKKQMQAPGLQEPAKKALATLDREWDGLIAHRDYPMVSLDNNAAERQIRGPVVTRKNAGGSRNGDAARNAAVIWTVTATARMAGLNVLAHLTAYFDECGRSGGKPLAGRALERLLPWNASPEDLRTWARPPPAGPSPRE